MQRTRRPLSPLTLRAALAVVALAVAAVTAATAPTPAHAPAPAHAADATSTVMTSDRLPLIE